ncbi:Fur family transcriptional regulator [Nocardiopsis sp. CC223A]|uniref:Fur family transcriptional regulator n=1 Tax=Nocardiopsis sp. CC223A TaxID=3044051 RepID=UPI00278BB0B6|nr:transcriptional repressor [Nocardiopsis sp. CC223A]
MGAGSRYDGEVLAALRREDRFRSCQEVHALIADSRGGPQRPPSLSTVYRTLHRLAREGEVDTIQSEDGERLYRRCETPSHHHLLCRVCGHAQEVPHARELRTVLTRVERSTGFTGLAYSLEFAGVCPDCA